MLLLLILTCALYGVFISSACETSSLQNIRVVLSDKANRNTKDLIIDGCLEQSDDLKGFYGAEISNQNVENLHKGALTNLTFTRLILSNNRISAIDKQAFFNLKNVQTLDLSRNKLRAIFNNVINEMVSVKTLDLSWNLIDQIEDQAFAHMVSLEQFKLTGNRLKVWNANWFGNNVDLSRLDLEGNLLEILPEDAFKDMEKLNQLNLRNNQLKEIHQNAFRGLSTLKTLDLGVNKLRSLHDNTFAPFNGALDQSDDRFNIFAGRGYNPFAGLYDLYIHTNNLTYFSEKMMSDLRNTRSLGTLTFHSNPWQCACYRNIMNWIDKSNIMADRKGIGCYRRDNPVCIVPKSNPEQCVEEVQGEDIRELYFSKFKVPVDNFFDRNVVCNIL